jgi:hypothetical protein
MTMARPTANTGDPTAQRYLASGWELCKAKLGYTESAPARSDDEDDLRDFPLLGTIGPTDVVGEDDTTGSFYRRWASKGRFLADLARYIVANGRFADGGPSERARALVMRLGDITTLGDLIRSGARSEVELLTDDPTFAFQLQMWSIRRRYAWIQDELRESFDEATEGWGDAYELIFRLYGMRLRPGFDGRRLAVAITALVDGMAIRRGIDPDTVDEELFPEALLALLRGVLEHDDGNEGVSVADAFDQFVQADPQETIATRTTPRR